MENKLTELDLTMIENWLNNYVDKTEEKRGISFSPENFKHNSSLEIVKLIQKVRLANGLKPNFETEQLTRFE